MPTIIKYINDGKGKSQSHEVHIKLSNTGLLFEMSAYGETAQDALYNLFENLQSFQKSSNSMISDLQSTNFTIVDYYNGNALDSFYITDYYTGDKTNYTKEEVMGEFSKILDEKTNPERLINRIVQVIKWNDADSDLFGEVTGFDPMFMTFIVLITDVNLCFKYCKDQKAEDFKKSMVEGFSIVTEIENVKIIK